MQKLIVKILLQPVILGHGLKAEIFGDVVATQDLDVADPGTLCLVKIAGTNRIAVAYM